MSDELTPVSRVVLRLVQLVWAICVYPSILLRGRGDCFKPLERSLLEALAEHLDKDSAGILREQMAELNYVRRTTLRSTECDFFRVVPFRFDRHRSARVPLDASEALLCSARFRTESGTQHFVKAHIVHGNFFELEFGDDMREHFNGFVTELVSFTQPDRSSG